MKVIMHSKGVQFGLFGDTQIAMMKQATTEGAKLGYQQAASDLASGKGSISKAMMRWNTNRRTG